MLLGVITAASVYRGSPGGAAVEQQPEDLILWGQPNNNTMMNLSTQRATYVTIYSLPSSYH